MKTLYQHIKNYPSEGSLKQLFNELKLNEGYDLLQKLNCTSSEMLLVAKYTCEAYDPESLLHEAFKIRSDLKKAILNDYGIKDTGIFGEIIANKNDNYNEYTKWYYGIIQDYDFQAIISLQELIEELLHVANMKIDKSSEMDDDKFLKAMNLKNTCMTNAIDGIEKLKEIKERRLKTFERTDEAVNEEVYKNSGSAEQSALYAKTLKNKNGHK